MTPSPDREPGLVHKAFRRLFMRRATVAACEDLGDRFRLITLEGPQLRGVAWVPGQKLQVAMGATFATRTYTPIDWDGVAGRTRILGYRHGDTPGSTWIRDATVGDSLDVFGPRRSLDASQIPTALAVFGDETSIGLAHAFQSDIPGRPVACRFEAAQLGDAELAIARLGLTDARLFAQAESEAHLDQMAGDLPALAAAGATFILTGRALSIQRLRQSLRQLAVPGDRVMAKAYWAPGKSGLD